MRRRPLPAAIDRRRRLAAAIEMPCLYASCSGVVAIAQVTPLAVAGYLLAAGS